MTTVAIIGSGPSAIYTLQALLRERRDCRITVFEAGETAGVGTPYDPSTTPVSMLANIASIEIPPVGVSLLSYLYTRSDDQLAVVGISRSDLTEREFYPRIAIGAYYRDRLAALVDDGNLRGNDVRIMARHQVVDIVPNGATVDVRFVCDGQTSSQRFDKVVLATGHTAVSRPTSRLPRSTDEIVADALSIGILGSSLSAIDAVVSIAGERGHFSNEGYHLRSGAVPFLVTLMSRGGHLPEADFYCPLPAIPHDGFTSQVVTEIAGNSAPGGVLAGVFRQFKAILAIADPAYASAIDLDSLDEASFAPAYFSNREVCDPFDWARENLEEARRNHRAKYTVPWRYAILRSHEAFAACLPALDIDELTTFNSGMRRVFADNYAAVPPASIERLLALRDAGALAIAKLSDKYELQCDADSGSFTVTNGSDRLSFDAILDARGQVAADDDDFPFPTLRSMLLANRDVDDRRDRAVEIDAGYRMANGINPVTNVWCLSIPFLIDRKPSIQGLTSAHEMGEAVAKAMFESNTPQHDRNLQDLANSVAVTSPVLADGAVMLVPSTPGRK